MNISAYITPKEETILHIATTLQTTNEIYTFVAENIKVIPDIQDYWQTPIETLNRAAGDCEDIANLLCSLLRAANHEAYVYIYYIPERIENHAVVLYNNKILDITNTAKEHKYVIPIVMYNEHYIIVYHQTRYENL